MIMQDKLEKERADAKNAVEEYVYEIRDKLYGDYEQYTKDSVRKLCPEIFLKSTQLETQRAPQVKFLF